MKQKHTRTNTTSLALIIVGLGLTSNVSAQEGPFSPDDWPKTADPDAVVHYVDSEFLLSPPGDGWIEDGLRILSGGDQVTTEVEIAGVYALKVSVHMNVADDAFEEWADHEVIDILMLVYGNSAVLGADGQPRNFQFLTGTLPEIKVEIGGLIPVEGRNQKWNWVLFRIPNGTRGSDGTRLVGSIPDNAQGSYTAGGVNGGTIRLQPIPGLIVRAVAFGEKGAFGEPEQVNVFFPYEECQPEPNTNHVFVDIAKKTSNHLTVINDDEQPVTYADDIGPADDKRRAVAPLEGYINFGITDNYLGLACNEPKTVKVCVEYYDDPANEGTVFGPDAYAVDSQGGVAYIDNEKLAVLEGTGKWVQRAWVLNGVNLLGVDTAPLTGGPRFIADGEPVFISRIDFAVMRTGDHPLAGEDPLADCIIDPRVCEYGNYAELDLQKDIQNGIDLGGSGGDQEMVVDEAGPEGDVRLAVRPAWGDGSPNFAHSYLNFAVTDEVFGPSSQPNAHLAICLTYYDDPELIGATLRPEVYKSEMDGNLGFAFTSPDLDVSLEGSGTWKTAYWELPDINFSGVNQGPQAAARFTTSGKIWVSRVQYGVIRNCGPDAGVNPLEECKPVVTPEIAIGRTVGGAVRLSWPASADGFQLQSTPSLGGGEWSPVGGQITVDEDQNAIVMESEDTAFFRLAK
jgi:hypothetical protein